MFIGPYYQNTKVIADSLENIGSLIKIFDKKDLFYQVEKYLCSDEKRQKMGKRAKKWIGDQSGFIEQSLDIFLKSF